MKKILALILVIGLAVICVSQIKRINTPVEDKIIGWQNHVVEAGDSLYNLAKSSSEDYDVYDIIDIIKHQNGITGDVIYTGDTIYIPIFE